MFDIRAKRDTKHDRVFLPIRPGQNWFAGIAEGAGALVEDEFAVIERIRLCGTLSDSVCFEDNTATAFGLGDVGPHSSHGYPSAAPRKHRKTAAEFQQEAYEASERDQRKARDASASVEWNAARDASRTARRAERRNAVDAVFAELQAQREAPKPKPTPGPLNPAWLPTPSQWEMYDEAMRDGTREMFGLAPNWTPNG